MRKERTGSGWETRVGQLCALFAIFRCRFLRVRNFQNSLEASNASRRTAAVRLADISAIPIGPVSALLTYLDLLVQPRFEHELSFFEHVAVVAFGGLVFV